ncbi:MAG: class I SAM-dependent DNA methyltransferase [Lutimaribacter sp.]
MSTDPETLALYNARAGEYAQLTAAARPGQLLRQFIAAMPPGGDVLDLGCGPGIDASHMAAAGLQVWATDAASAMVVLAANQPGVRAELADFTTTLAKAPTASLDGVWANFSLLHAPAADIPRHLAAIAQALRPGGHLHIALKTGQGSARDSLGRLYTYFTPPQLIGLVETAGLQLLRRRDGQDMGLDGVPAPWVALLAKRG